MTYHTDNRIRKYSQGYGFMSFGKKILNKGISASKRIKTAGNFLKNSTNKFNESKYGKMLKKKEQKLVN